MSANQLSREEFLSGDNAGLHTVEGESIVGFKKIKCECNSNKLWQWLTNQNTETQIISAVAKVEIPDGATIVRPAIQTSSRYIGEYEEVSNKLRTDKLIVKEIKAIETMNKLRNLSNCSCSSFFLSNVMPREKSYYYRVGKVHKPREPLDKNVTEQCTSGLHFFLNESEAQNYLG